MGNNKPGFAIILFCLFAMDVSRASFLDNFRKLVAQAPTENNDRTGSPIPSPVSGGNKPSSNKSKDTPPVMVTPPASKEKEVKQGDANSEERTNESCDGAERSCKDSNSIVACVKEVDNAANVLVLLIQNKRDMKLMVDIRTPSANHVKQVEITKHMAEKVNISAKEFPTQIILTVGDGDCVLKMSSPSVSSPTTYGNFVNGLPSYSSFLTPIYGAYFLLGLSLIAGGVFGCCKLRKRRRLGDEIPYQELEMGGTGTTVDVETADGWDEGWDDDWDDEKAVRSPGGLPIQGSISANGLTPRAAKKEGWDD